MSLSALEQQQLFLSSLEPAELCHDDTAGNNAISRLLVVFDVCKKKPFSRWFSDVQGIRPVAVVNTKAPANCRGNYSDNKPFLLLMDFYFIPVMMNVEHSKVVEHFCLICIHIHVFLFSSQGKMMLL